MTQLLNYLNLTEEHGKPEIGIGATICGYTDRKPATVIKISKSGKTVWLQEDGYTRTDNNGMSDCQKYDYHADPNGYVQQARLTKNGWRIGGMKGSKVLIGVRDRYYDYSF